MLSLRHKTNDHFWFSFFHEAAHLVLHGKRLRFIDMVGELNGEHENEANEFARNLLIPENQVKHLQKIGSSETAICNFADELGIAPGIVVGRMQKEELLPWRTNLNSLKVSYEWEIS